MDKLGAMAWKRKMLTDTHAHLDFPQLAEDVLGVIARAEAAGVRRIVTIGTTIEGSRRAVELAERFPQVWAAVGIHPNHATEAGEDFLPELRALAAHPRVVAIGETGMDYFHLPGRELAPELAAAADAESKAKQASAFYAQLALATELGLPVVIHERGAWEATLDVLKEFTGRVRGVFHCFGKSPEHAAEVRALGHLVSFTGIVTFKNAPEAQASAATVPEFMVETDAPYLAPVPHRGKPCEPAYVRLTAEHIARLRGVSLEELAAHTETVANGFFRFGAR